MIPLALDRRRFLVAAAATVAAPRLAAANGGFGMADVEAIAEARSREPHIDAVTAPSGPFADLDYAGYRALRLRPERRIWADAGLGFTVEPLAPGHVFRNAVAVHVVDHDEVRPIPFDAGAFELEGAGDLAPMAWSGVRIRSSFGGPDADQDAAVFQGASYFRAAGRGQRIGLAARAIALGTGSPSGEEFPAFTALWLHRPEPGADVMIIHALLEGSSLTGAYEFRLRPGGETTIEVRATLFPRQDLENVGMAPLTSMFFLGPADTTPREDWRPAVHGSEGLSIVTGRGERLWRPLANPQRLRMSLFGDDNPKGFGLQQRSRDFEHFDDETARFDLRPSAWVSPMGEWGQGAIQLVEIPSNGERNENIVAFWRPDGTLAAGQAHRFAYRLTFAENGPDDAPLARVLATRAGPPEPGSGSLRVAVDFIGVAPEAAALRAALFVNGEATEDPALTLLPGGRVRAGFTLSETRGEETELRLTLEGASGPASETWLYRWSAP